LVNIFVVVDAIGLETDFTLETNRKRMKETLLKSTLRLRKQAIFLLLSLKHLNGRIWALQATFEAVLSAVDMT